jgi:hypothetical protein
MAEDQIIGGRLPFILRMQHAVEIKNDQHGRSDLYLLVENRVERMHPHVEILTGEEAQLKQGIEDAEGRVAITRQNGRLVLPVIQLEILVIVPDEVHVVVEIAEQMSDTLVLIGERAHVSLEFGCFHGSSFE